MQAATLDESLPTAPDLTYAIGDVHGRLDLLEKMTTTIIKDAGDTGRGQQPTLVLLGDLIDRGPQSRGCIQHVVRLQGETTLNVKSILGNHEHALLQFLEDPSTGASWIRHGGGATLTSYGCTPPKFVHDEQAWADTRDDLREALPKTHLECLQGMKLWYETGDYLFVHAGVRPGRSLDEQDDLDLLTIRDEFMKSEKSCDKVVVHGHTPLSSVRLRRWRISLDTGAYASGLLSAIRLQGQHQKLIQVCAT